jgi:hypoxanthine phosphoribosyltransferase
MTTNMINPDDIQETLITAQEIDERLTQIANDVDDFYKNTYEETGQDLILLGVLTGSALVMSDFSRKLNSHVQIDWMSLSSYGSGTKSSGVVRVNKDLTCDIAGRDILIVEDIIDSGLTLSWLIKNLESKGARSVNVMALLKKEFPNLKDDNRTVPKWQGFSIEDKFVVGYGLDYANRYRNLPYIGVLNESVYE